MRAVIRAHETGVVASLQKEVEAAEQSRQGDQRGAAGEWREEGAAPLRRPKVSRRLAQ
jgi:hypothetical protein